jgi:hypothetical protein
LQISSLEVIRKRGSIFRLGLGYCDMGPSKTPILKDHDKFFIYDASSSSSSGISRWRADIFLPCHFHIRAGQRVTSCAFPFFERHNAVSSSGGMRIRRGRKRVRYCCRKSNKLWAPSCIVRVPAGRVFMFAASHIGEMFSYPRVWRRSP